MIFQRTDPARYDASLIGSLRRVGLAFIRYAHARARLAQAEAQQAGRHATRMAALAGSFVFCAVAAYGALIVAVTAWMASYWWNGRWAPAFLVTAGAHALIALGCGLALRRVWRRGSLFPATRREFKEDRKWLTSKTSTN
jgi:uncharacterized membrane protein YqjE